VCVGCALRCACSGVGVHYMDSKRYSSIMLYAEHELELGYELADVWWLVVLG